MLIPGGNCYLWTKFGCHGHTQFACKMLTCLQKQTASRAVVNLAKKKVMQTGNGECLPSE